MGGKQNRTRNNVRPSNSGRSAAMLHSSLPQFAGFSGGNKPVGLSSFAFNPSEEFDSSIDDNFQLVLKKVSKKDSTTKLKGLQEFADLLQKADVPIVKTLLPIWPRFYSLLVIHPDNRIREATQNVHHIIVLKVRRDIAPYLKQLMAPWYTSQYDNYPPAAAAAIQAFKDTFSQVKFKDAVNFCHLEILNYIHDNLLIQTAQNIASNQFSPEEAEARYERIVISCLQGYSMYLKEVSDENITESLSLDTQIVANKKFWKLATSKVPLVRTSWFQVLSVILQKVVGLLKSKESQTMATILNSLEDSEPSVLPRIWECLLLATAIPDWWKYVNLDQQFTPKISNILKLAAQGNAKIVYPNFLPLLSNLPSMDDKKKKQFYVNFFENMCSGMKLKTVSSNSQESKALSTAYIECLQFLVSKNATNVSLCKNLIKQLCTLIEWCLTKEAVSYKTTFSETAKFISYLARNSNLGDIQVLTECFFSSLYDIFYRFLNHTDNVLIVAEKQVEFLLALKCDETHTDTLDDFGVKVFEMYLSYIERTSSNGLFAPLYVLINGFQKQMFESLLGKLKEDMNAPGYMDIYRKWFKNWLTSDKTYCSSVLDITFLLMPYLYDLDKEMVLNDLLELNQPDCVTCSVQRALSQPHADNPIVQKWLKGQTISDLFISIADKCIANECNPELANIFRLALTENHLGELLLDKEVLNRVIAKLSTNISTGWEDSTCRLIIHMCKVIYTPTHLLAYGDQLLLALFNLSCKFNAGNAILEVNLVWKSSLTILLRNLTERDSRGLIEKFLNLIEENFRSILIDRRRGHIDALSYIVRDVVETLYTSHVGLMEWFVGYLTGKSCTIRENMVDLCKMAEYVKGTLDSPHDEIAVQTSVDEEHILSYFIYNSLKILVLGIKLDNAQIETVLSDTSENIADTLLEVLYSYTIMDTFLKHFNNIKYYNEIHYYHCLFEQRIHDMFKCIQEDTLTELKSELEWNCFNHAWFWCKTTYLFYSKFFYTADILTVYNQLSMGITEASLLGLLHVAQIFVEKRDVYDSSSLFAEIEYLRKENLSEFLYEHCDISWLHANRIIKSVKQCKLLMETSTLTQRHWDFIVLSMVSWISNCLKAKQLVKQYQYQSMLISTIELYVVIFEKIAEFKEEHVNVNYVNEWEDVLLEGIHADLTQIWIFLADNFSKSNKISLLDLPLLQSFGKVTDYFRHDLIFKDYENLPKWTKFLKISSGALLTNSQAILQLWGYKMLLVLVPGLVKIDDEAVNTTTPHRNGLIFEQFKEKLIEVQDIVNSVLIDIRVGESSCKVEPSYDSFTYTFAYLLLWDVMLCLCEKASTELRYQYSDWLKNSSVFHQFLSNLFKLMPTEALHYEEGILKSSTDIFLKNPVDSTCYSKFCDSETIENFACYLYKSSLEQFPALVRQWWTVLDLRTSQIVEKVTELYVSPYICSRELNSVVQHQNVYKNLKVKVMPSVREIQAIYTVDEAQMELTITLPTNYPLGSPDVLCNRQISGTSQKQWLLQFKKCVLHQDGKIWDGLSLWNSNLDRKFDGVEECYICYAVLHSGTYQLPKLCCRTCKKKFHSACLYKWFSTSNKSSCPICRNLF